MGLVPCHLQFPVTTLSTVFLSLIPYLPESVSCHASSHITISALSEKERGRWINCQKKKHKKFREMERGKNVTKEEAEPNNCMQSKKP